MLTHAVGTFLFMAGTVALLIKAYSSHDNFQIVSAYVFGGSLVLMYLISSMYHAVNNNIWKDRLQLLDHAAIFILIAGTYTPFLLVSLRDVVHLSFITIMWCIALAGIMYKLLIINHHKLISTLIYLAMGWMAIFKIKSFYEHLPFEALMWILIGGMFYSVGTIFYSKESIHFNHAIWHLFVLCGSVSHFIAIYLYVY